MNDDISDKDKKDWQTFISGKEKLHDKDFKVLKNNKIKTRSIDLHGYTLEHANNAIEKFTLQAFHDKVTKLIVVTGKGIHSDVETNNQNLMKIINDITDATIEDGGSGAFYIYLKKNKK